MRLLKELKSHNISFQIDVLEKQDSVFIRRNTSNYQIIHILDGLMQVLKIFTNDEKICLSIAGKDQTISCKQFNSQQYNYYYLLVATTKTTIVTICTKKLQVEASYTVQLSPMTRLNIDDYCKHDIASILSHRSTKKRIIQLLIILMKQFGSIKSQDIIIPFHLSHQAIAEITGSQRITVNRIMNKLKEDHTIGYSSKKITIRNIARLILT